MVIIRSPLNRIDNFIIIIDKNNTKNNNHNDDEISVNRKTPFDEAIDIIVVCVIHHHYDH